MPHYHDNACAAVSPEEFCEHLRSFIGIPYKHQGRNRYGLDCVGLVIVALDELGILPARYKAPKNYGRVIGNRLVDHIGDWCVPGEKLQPGVMLSIDYGQGTSTHVLMYVGGKNSSFIHACGHGAVKGVIEQRYGEPWVRRTTGIWHLPGVDYCV